MKIDVHWFMIICFWSLQVAAQERSPVQQLIYADVNYLSTIKTVQFYHAKEEQSVPILPLNSAEQLDVSFDDLRADTRTYYYTIEHCTADWQSSGLSTMEFIDGLTEDRINDYKSSVNTLQAYTHYQFRFPSEGSLVPKLAGNYLLKVYEDGDADRLILTRRFYVLKQEVGVQAQLLPSADVLKRKQHQKLNATVLLGNLVLNNPYQDIKLVVQQNRRVDIQETLTKPMYIRNGQLIYNNNRTLDFDGGNEFKNLDIRSFRLLSGQIDQSKIDRIKHLMVIPDHDLADEAYSFTFDEDGKFFIRNNDFDDADIEGDYAWVTFTLKTDKPVLSNERVYVVGLFNNFQESPENEMKYNAQQQTWEATLLLKQGLYHYTYLSKVTGGKEDVNKYNGHHFETGNTYHIFVYYRKPATRWDELIGYGSLNNSSKGTLRD